MTSESTKRGTEAGGALIVALITMMVCVTVAFSALKVATGHHDEVQRAGARVQSRALAEAGVQRAIAFLEDTMAKDPWNPIAPVDAVLLSGPSPGHRLATEEPLMMDGRQHGTFTVQMEAQVDGGSRNVLISCTGYYPNREQADARSTAQAMVRLEADQGGVFDYSYFINNWGWFYGNTIESHGNARSNGQFDAAGYSPGVYGTPRFSHRVGNDLMGYQDDNGDGLTDGSDGGIYAGWGIVDTDHVLGMGGLPQNHHDFLSDLPMPNLSRLEEYEARAVASASSIELGGQQDGLGNPAPNLVLCDEVLGDDVGEVDNLVLIGTEDEPLVLDGPVVVRGDVIIKGVVTGQGAIYAGGNVYVADDLVYLDPPTTTSPASPSEADTEAWLAANQDKDFVGLFARGHVVLGDYEDSNWSYYVGWWLDHPMNESAEDSGADRIPNTADGRDGIPGTEDDDLLEGDGVWTVQSYTQDDADLGLIPAGFSVGDPIPGTGEDIDGDGEADGRTSLSDLALSSALSSGCWTGNLPEGTACYCDLASMTITHVDASIYTNHTMAMVTLAGGQDFQLFGSAVCRNESLIYGTDRLKVVHDPRLSGGGQFLDLLPTPTRRVRVLGWKSLDDGDVAVHVPSF